MTTMIERVASAVGPEIDKEWVTLATPSPRRDAVVRAVARAAIAAMREPTDGMIESAYVAASMDDRWHIEDARHYRHAHSAAIDAALEEKL